VNLLKIFRTFIEDIEDAMPDGGFKRKRRNITPGKLHNSFRRNRSGSRRCHDCLSMEMKWK
jgi:hypothetical protein